MHCGHKTRAITLLFLNEIIPLAIPYYSSPLRMSMQSLKKIGPKVLKLEHGNEVLMDIRTDGQTDGRRTDGRTDTQSSEGIAYYPASFCVAGYRKNFRHSTWT